MGECPDFFGGESRWVASSLLCLKSFVYVSGATREREALDRERGHPLVPSVGKGTPVARIQDEQRSHTRIDEAGLQPGIVSTSI